jgi:hypothetical protein
MDAQHGGLEAQNGALENLVVADPRHFDEEQDPEPDPHLSKKLDPDPN